MIPAIILWSGLGCQSSIEGPADKWIERLDEARLWRRMSIDLSGKLPDITDTHQLLEGSVIASEMRHDLLENGNIERGMMHLLSSQWPMQSENFHISYNLLQIAPVDAHWYYQSVGEEPLRLATNLIVNNRPWSEIVTADYTMATELSVSLFPLSPVQDTDAEWFPAKYTDNRPNLGIISTNGFLWNFQTAKYQRSRANAISKWILCDDYLQRPVQFPESFIFDLNNIEEATQSVPSCQSCHSTMDSTASALFGFEPMEAYNLQDAGWYHAERERLGYQNIGLKPAWYGNPITVHELGSHITSDPRFTQCAVRTFASALWHREPTPSDFTQLTEWTNTFEKEDLRIKALLYAITDSVEYQADYLHQDAPDEYTSTIVGQRLLSPYQLADIIEDATGFRWEDNGWDQMTNDVYGFRIMSGGVRPPFTVQNSNSSSTTQLLVLKRLAQAAARFVVEDDLTSNTPRMLTLVNRNTQSIDEAFKQQIKQLHLRLFSIEATDAEVSALQDLWNAPESATVEDRWSLVLTVLLRDPRFWSY